MSFSSYQTNTCSSTGSSTGSYLSKARSDPASWMIYIVLAFLNSIIILSYLGWSFEPQEIDPNDWKRKWIIFFGYISLISGAFYVLKDDKAYFIPGALLLFTSLVTLLYCGWSFENNSQLDATDWKRRVIIFFAWFGLVVYGFMILIMLMTVIGILIHISTHTSRQSSQYS